MTIDDLIARLEAATEGGRELDVALAKRLRQPIKKKPVYKRGHYSGGKPVVLRTEDVASPYTTSLDAALTLVPEGHRLRLWWHHTGVWGCDVFPDGGGAIHRVLDRATPALALCIAALKARKP